MFIRYQIAKTLLGNAKEKYIKIIGSIFIVQYGTGIKVKPILRDSFSLRNILRNLILIWNIIWES
jgi:hypothetical protein